MLLFGLVAQLDRVSVSGAEGYGFDSLRGHKMFYTYILYSNSFNRFYIGQCGDVTTRLAFHNGGYVKSTKPYLSWELIGFIEKSSRSEAVVLERKLKNLNTEDLKKFILKYFNKTFNGLEQSSMAR